MLRTVFFRLHIGGYWASDGSYNGGVSRCCRVDFEHPSVAMLVKIVSEAGFPENMSKFSYFHREKRVDIGSDRDVADMLYSTVHVLDSINIYVVRSDDPYLDDVLTGEVEEEEESEHEDCDFYCNDYAESDDSDDDAAGEIEFYVGQEFVSKEKCREVIEKYAVKKTLNIHFKRSERKKVEAVCSQACCKWRLYASINSTSDCMVVRSYAGPHTCYPTGAVDLYTAPKIAADYLNEFRTNLNLSANQIMDRLSLVGIRVSKSKCQSARQIMKHIISDEYAEQFTRMYDYVEELRRTNPGSTVILGTKDRVFEKFYTCFEAQKSGWKSACRRVIHLDGTFLKGRMKGQLLTAVGRDPNNQMFIIAWAIVPVENKVYWERFMELLQEDLSLGEGNGIAISSDQQKGLIHAIQTVLPFAEHRMCARHIFANLQKRYKQMGPLHKLFWKCARAYNKGVFQRQLEKMKNFKPEAFEEVKRSVSANWSRSCFSDTTKAFDVENNISESYNAVLKDARKKPVVALLEDIRRHVMSSSLEKKRDVENATGIITPKAQAILEKRKKSLKWCKPFPTGRGLYEVDHGKHKYVVNVRNHFSCTCREYDVSGIPCCHLMSAMWEEYKETVLPESIVSDWYSMEKWRLCYNNLLFPINGMDLWETHSDVVVMPPPDRIMPGRPKNNDRVRDPSEARGPASSQTNCDSTQETPSQKIIVTCSNCGVTGHNKRTCQQEPVPQPPKPIPQHPSYHAKAVITCGNCRQQGHNKRNCKRDPVPKPPNLPPGRPSKKKKLVNTQVDDEH